MDNKPLQDFPQENEATGGEQPIERPGLITKWIESLARLGLGESALRIGTNVTTILCIVLVVWLMQTLYKPANLGWISNVDAAAIEPTPTPALDSAQLPALVAFALDGVSRQAIAHTIIPTRPREDVVKYTVQTGDSVFVIADKFGLKPSTILFGNFNTLSNDVDLLRPGQVLNILPVDGTYYQWQGSETLTGVAKFYKADPQAIINSPANHLDPDTIGDLSHPNIPGGTWLVIPGGSYLFSWHAPVVSRNGPPVAAVVTGQGYCGAVSGGLVGFGTFIFPTVEHWLSGTDYRPDVGHYGVDFAGSLGNAVYATDAGVIVYAGWNDWGYGNLIIVDHGNGWQSYYGHLSQINISCDQSVGQGDVIGLIGATGHATGPHLHFELHYNGAPVNPHTVLDITSP
ncbi:MAG: LysM peptidoglycan-binding domain-containing M23 family metallopeptidase [Anaerolineales bacterium]|jgi:murein DD-endopeptidase MepM/ murein hydrolase activator NlpD